MSMNFALDTTPNDWETAPYVIACGCPDAAPLRFPTARLAAAWALQRNADPEHLRAVPHGCTDDLCRAYPLHPVPATDWFAATINVTNLHGAQLLEILGLGGQESPRISGTDLLGRVLVALALLPVDEGTPDLVDGNVITCGRRPGYLQMRLADLHALAQTALDLGRDVVVV